VALHFRGLEVPPLNSPRDVIFRKYLLREAKIEAKKQLLPLLTVIATPAIQDPGSKSQWDRQAKKIFDEYVSLLCGEEISESDREEKELLEFYENHIKKSKPVLSGNSKFKGPLVLSNIPAVYRNEFNADGSERKA